MSNEHRSKMNVQLNGKSLKPRSFVISTPIQKEWHPILKKIYILFLNVCSSKRNLTEIKTPSLSVQENQQIELKSVADAEGSREQ